MKRGIILIVAFLICIIILTTITAITSKAITIRTATGEAITGEIVTGKASAQPTNVSIFVTAAVPVLTILSPKNQTYLTNTSLLLNYSASNADNLWYNLDNTPNTTITSYIYFNATQGQHTLWLFANNSYGTTTRNVSFIANSTRLTINYDEYKGAYKGNSTDFLSYTYEDVQSLSSIIMEHTTYGKILFNQAINLIDDANPSDNIVDIDTYTNISLNRIELNSTALPNFNKPATLQLYGLTFTNPRILRDNEVCSSSICTQESYSRGTLKFNVTGFSVYSAEETPTTTTPSSGGGGGGGEVTTALKFSVAPELVKVVLKKGESFTKIITIRNDDVVTQKFSIETTLKELIVAEEKEFTLGPGEEKSVSLVFYAPETIEPDTYTGKIKIYNLIGYQGIISIILNIRSKIMLFDVTLKVPSAYKEIKPGKELMFEATLFNLGETEKINVKINYYIKDFEGNIIAEKEGKIEVETQATFLESLTLPKNISSGEYVVGINAVYDESIGTASDIFYVNKGKKLIYIIIAGIIILILIIIIISISRHYNKKLKKLAGEHIQELNRIEEKINQGSLKTAEAMKIKNRLASQLSLLNKAYSKGYIKKESYEKSRERIKNTIEKLKKKYL